MGRGRRKSESLPKGQEGEAAAAAAAGAAAEAGATVKAEVKAEDGRVGAFGLQEAPAFHPTEEEFENPLRYIAQIRAQAEPYGICRIVPPESWNPPFGLDTVKFAFPTKLQAIHHLQERPAACDADTFKLEYTRFLRKTGKPVERWPVLDGEELDLCKLFNAVKRHGGLERVTLEDKWGEVWRMLTAGGAAAPPASSSSSSSAAAAASPWATLRQLYEKHLCTFEAYQTRLASGKRWRAKRKQETTTEKVTIKVTRAARKRQSDGGVDLDEGPPASAAAAAPAASSDGIKSSAANSSADNELCEVLRPLSSEVETRYHARRVGRSRPPGAGDGAEASGEATAGGGRKAAGESPVAQADSSGEAPPSSGDAESRSQAQQQPQPQRKRRKTEEKVGIPEEGLGRTDQICEQCHSGAHEQLMLLCDRCDRGWHLYCLSPPLAAVPVGNWYCLECLASESESFGFGQGQEYHFDSFRRMADRFKRKWLQGRPAGYADLEREFWRVVEGGTAPVEVLYGSDLDTGVYGSGFPRPADPIPSWATAEEWAAGASSPWNVNNFPKLDGSMLRLVHDNIPGVMVPWLYIGMLFSSFCWHYEDHCFYSVNYLHCGEPKSWYSVPGSAAEDFEKVMQKSFPDLFQAQPDLLFQLVTMLKPTVLRESGVPVCMTVQEPRNFVVTFPRSYHGGFNHGFNCAEAVNFAPSDWLPFGGFGVERYRLYHKAAVLSHDELLCVVAKNDPSCRKSPWLQQELSRVVAKERYQREYLWSLGMIKSSQMAPRQCQDHIGAEEDSECIICRYYLHLSAVVCECRPGKAVCLQHARQLCECGTAQQSLEYRFTLAELDDLIANDQSLEECKAEEVAAAPASNKRRLRRGQNGASSIGPLVKKVKGRLYKHLEIADMWLSQARGAGRSHLRSPLLEDLLNQAEQFLWGGHEMDQVREMVRKLNTARTWVQDVAACASAVEREGHGSSLKHTKVSLATVRKLVTVDPIPWVEPHLLALKAAFERANGLEQQILGALSSSELEIRNLQALQQEASHSPFELSGLLQLNDTLSTAQAWSDRAKRLLAGPKVLRTGNRNDGVDLAQLRALHTEGAEFRVSVAEKKILEAALQNVATWQEQATQLLARSCTLQELEETLRGSESLVVRTEEVAQLDERVRKAKAWIQSVASLKLPTQQQANGTPSIKMLETLLQDGRCLQVHGLAEMDVLEVQMQRATWIQRASQSLQEFSSVDLLRGLTEEATRLQLADETLCREILVTISDACAWEEKADQLLRRGGSLVAFTDLASAAERIRAILLHLDPVKKAIAEAKSWLHRAQPFCKLADDVPDGSTTDQADLSTLQALVVDSQKLSVVLDEQKVLREAFAAADSWVCKARTLKASVFVSEPSEIQQGCSLNRKADSFGEVCTSDHMSAIDASKRLHEDLHKLQATLSEGLRFGMKIPETADLEDLCKSTRWSLKALDLVKCSPSVKEVEAHLEEATGLSVTIPEYYLLQRMLNNARAWLQAAAAFLPGFGVKGTCTEEQLEILIADAQQLQVSVDSETVCLEDILASHRTWKRKVQDALQGTTCFTWADLIKLQESGEADMVHIEEEHLLNYEILETGSWMLRCHEQIALRPHWHGITLENLFTRMRNSVELAMLHLEPVEKRTRLGLTCVCQAPIDESDDNLLKCDDCHDWYHPACVAETQAQFPGRDRYKCPYCVASSSGSLVTREDLRLKIHATQRPKIGLLQELVSSSQMRRCRIKEKELLESVVELVQEWERRLQSFLGPALVCPDRSSAAGLQVFAAVQKAVEAIEVQTDGELLLPKALAANSWRNRTLKLLEDPHKPLQRTLTRMIKEGMALQIPAEDFAMNELKEIEARASLWAAQAKEAVCDQGRMSLPEIEALITEGEKLPVTVSKVVSALRERSVLYCVCRKPYDEERAMIACDRCGEWYHFSCINLPEPDSSDEETDDAIQQECELSGEFVCPQCKELSLTGEDEGIDVGTAMSYRDEVLEQAGAIGHGMGGHFSGLVRGKRSNRSSKRARGELQQKWSSPLFASGKLLWHTQRRRKQQEQPDGSVSASGRPCRRTAGRHSGFESFVLLMRSR